MFLFCCVFIVGVVLRQLAELAAVLRLALAGVPARTADAGAPVLAFIARAITPVLFFVRCVVYSLLFGGIVFMVVVFCVLERSCVVLCYVFSQRSPLFSSLHWQV